MSTGIKETRELLSAVGAVAVRLVDDLKDGKLSLAEAAAFLTELGTIRKGLQGITSIPAELKDLDEAERDELLKDVAKIFLEAGLSHRFADSGEKVLRLAYNVVTTLVDLRNAPPTAELAE